MGRFTDFLGGIARRTSNAVQATTGYSLSSILNAWNQQWRSVAGEVVTPESAARMLDVYAAVRVRAEAFASCPPCVYEVVGRGKEEAVDHPLYYLLSTEPNPEMSADVFWQTMEACKALTGNAYAQISRNKAGQPAAFYPLHPRKTRPVRMPDNSLRYETWDGMSAGQTRLIPASDILHFRLWSMDGLVGLSPIENAMQALGIAIAAEKFGARFFSNGGRPNGVLSTASNLTDKQLQDMRDTWNGQVGGENQGKTGILYGDWKYQSVGITPEEAQFLETRKYSRTQIAALIGVPPHKIGDTTRLSNSNHEQEELGFVTDTLRPSIMNAELECKRKVFPVIGRNSGRFIVEFDLRNRMRADFKTMHEALALGRQWGWYTTNDCRWVVGENPVGPEGDVLLYPLNMGNSKALLHDDALIPVTAVKSPGSSATDESQKSLPGPVDNASPSDEERSVVGQYAQGYISLFHDATGRVTKRTKRDLSLVSQVFEPILRSMQDQVDLMAQTKQGLPEQWHVGAEKLRQDHLRGIEQRSQQWTPESVAENAGIELNKAIRAIVVNTARDAAAAKALACLEGVGNAA